MPKDFECKKLPFNLFKLRMALALPLDKFSKRCKVSKSYVNKLERNPKMLVGAKCYTKLVKFHEKIKAGKK
jgi:hypothetical protein